MQYLAIAAAVICFCSLFVFFLKIIKLGKPKDLSEPSGDVAKGVAYSNTVAMMPQNKESAYLHLPAYASGMLFHIGIFLSLLVFVFSFFPFFNRWISGPDKIHYIIPCLLAVSSLCGYIFGLRHRHLILFVGHRPVPLYALRETEAFRVLLLRPLPSRFLLRLEKRVAQTRRITSP